MWLIITTIAYALNAISVAVDKVLLTKQIPNPAVYAFFISILSLVAVVLIPFGFKAAEPASIIVALISGITFCWALWAMFTALSRNEASRITPFIGGLQPLIIAILAYFILNEVLGVTAIAALILIVAGTALISYETTRNKGNRSSYYFAILATLLFAISYTLAKLAFNETDFITGFVWTRIGAVLGALPLLISAINRRDIAAMFKSPKQQKQTGGLFIIGQVAGSLSFVLVNYAIAISGSVAIVNALQGLQFVFLLILLLALTQFAPKLIHETFTPKILVQKLMATALIIAGVALLFI